MHFCKAHGGCTGNPFELKGLSPAEQEIHNKLNSILVNGSGKVAITAETGTNQDEALTAFNDQMLKLEELMKKM